MSLAKLFQLSRSRFWIYVFGPYIVGLVAGARQLQDLRTWPVLFFGLFFLLPANLLIYGVNDIFDYETDKDNAKKIEYETLVTPDERPALWRAILITNAPFLLLLPYMSTHAVAALLAFLGFSVFYSSPPIRAKTIPIIDSAFNVLYIFPGVLSYLLVGGERVSLVLFVAAWCWAMAMHAYSAVPDITSDRINGLNTVATFLGFYGTLVFCAALYASAATLSFHALGRLSAALGIVYLILIRLSLGAHDEAGVLRIYKWFPLVNTLAGFVMFWWIVLSKFPCAQLLP